MLHSAKQWKHFAAMVLIGDGVMAMVYPSTDAEAWTAGPEWWKRTMRFFKERPVLTRVLAAAEIAGGIWWALANESPTAPEREWSGEDESQVDSARAA